VIWLACAAAAMPMVALAASAEAPFPTPSPSPGGGFALPDRPMVLTRTLRRPLPDGKEIITLRSYLLHFRPTDDGIRIDGELLAVTVDAPPALQAIAELERRRPDRGMFPMRLGHDGLLLAGNPAPAGAARSAAVDAVLSHIDTLDLAAPDMADAQAFASQFRGGGGGTPWPRDLFRPAPGQRQDHRAVPLPDGEQGSVRIVTDTAVTPTGLLATYTRRITTEMGRDRRLSVEEWSLVETPDAGGIILPPR
jgi:hypothetical protein